MRLNTYGRILHVEWLRTAALRSDIVLYEFVVTPNHFHGILVKLECRGTEQHPQPGGPTQCRGTAGRALTVDRTPTFEQFGKPVAGSLPTIMRSFKSAVTRGINDQRGTPGASVWQRGYYEHIIRDENELAQIQKYIVENPLKWEFDHENPNRKLPESGK